MRSIGRQGSRSNLHQLNTEVELLEEFTNGF